MTITSTNITQHYISLYHLGISHSVIPGGGVEPLAVLLGDLLDSPVHLLSLHLLLPLSEGSAALDHLVDEAAEAEPVRTEGVLLIVDDLRRHVAHSPHPASHGLALGDLHGQTKVRDPEMNNVKMREERGERREVKMKVYERRFRTLRASNLPQIREIRRGFPS